MTSTLPNGNVGGQNKGGALFYARVKPIKGEQITITKHGVPIAVLQPPLHLKKTEPRKIIAELRKFRDKHTLKGRSIREMIAEGRR